MTSESARARTRRVRLAAAACCALLAGCAEPGAPADPFTGLRTQAAQAPAPLRAPGAGVGSFEGGEAGAAAVRGFVRRAAPLGTPPSYGGDAEAEEGEFTLNFEGADLRDVVRTMIEDGLGESYVIDPAVSGSVTIRTNRALRREEILPTLEEILRLNGAAVVDRGGVLQVLPRDAVGLTAPLISARDAAARGLTLRVTPLRFVDVEDVGAVLSAFEPVSGAISFDRRRNLVFSIGTSAEQQTIAELLRVLDADAFAGRSFALQPLRHADPALVVDELAELFASPGAGAGPVRFLAIDRLSAVLAIANAPALLDDALSVMRSLDQIGARTPQLYVYAVENRRAAELAQVVGGLFGVEVASAAPARGGALGPGLTGAIEGDTATAEALAQPSPGGGGAASGTGEGAEGVVRISADESSNAVIALATASGARRVENALRRLDRQPLQVQLQATLAEVVLNDRLEFGVRWFFESGNWSGGFSDLASGAVTSTFPGFNAVFQTADIQSALRALDQITDVRLLSSPTLMVLDNEQARLQVGDQVPVTTRSSSSVINPDSLVTETEFRDTGVILTLRPRINQNGLVLLEVRQEVSDVIPSGDGENPTFSQRVVESTVAVDSGDTVAIGGLIRESDGRSRSGIPGLSRLPVIGSAFGASEFTGQRTELIVLITPVVIRDQRDARAATAEMRAKLEGIFGAPGQSYPLTGLQRGSLADRPAGLSQIGN